MNSSQVTEARKLFLIITQKEKSKKNILSLISSIYISSIINNVIKKFISQLDLNYVTLEENPELKEIFKEIRNY